MFNGKETNNHNTNLFMLVLILFSTCTQIFAQNQDIIKEDNFGKFVLNELMNMEVVSDISKEISLYEMSTAFTILDLLDIQQPVQKTNPDISWTSATIDLIDDNLHKWADATLGLYNQHLEKSDILEISIPAYPEDLLDVNELNFNDAKLIEEVLTSQENQAGTNPLLGLIWQINENVDVAIVGQHQLDMTDPDFMNLVKDQDETERALYAKFILRF